MSLNTPQPLPQHDADAGPECWPALLAEVPLEPELVALIRERDAMGRAKYGVPLRVWDGRDAVADALQEALDLVVYLQRALMRVPAPDPCRWSPYSLHDKLRALRNDAVRHARAIHALAGQVPEVRL